MNIQDVELQDRFLSSTEWNMKCLNKKDMKAWQLNRRHCIWNRTGIRHVYIECSALCAIEFLRSSRAHGGPGRVLRTHHLDIGHTHTPSSSRLIKCLVDIFSCIHLERRKAASGKGEKGVLLEDRHAQDPESEAAMRVLISFFRTLRCAQTLKVQTELTVLHPFRLNWNLRLLSVS